MVNDNLDKKFKIVKMNNGHPDSDILISRMVSQDPLFGKLVYHTPFTPYASGEMQLMCQRPFTSCEITSMGDVIVCCYDWLPLIIGNIRKNTIQEIWNGEKANALRATILDGSYKYCNNQTCLYLLSGGGELVTKEQFKLPDSDLPEKILLSVDKSCNLYCPSCRTKKIVQLEDENKEIATLIIKNTLQQLFKGPHNNPILLGFDGSGEVFNSAIYRNIFETESVFSNLYLWPNLRFRILTNGVMMTEKIQNRYSNIFNRISAMSVSVDAGNKESYNKVRLGGDWDLLWKNLDYLYRTQKHRNVEDFDWAWQVVLQEDNFESIPDLVDLAYNYPERLPFIVISPILNWGTFTDEDFKNKSVTSPTSKNYNQLMEILNTPKVSNYPRLVRPK
jgi:MoaA/NifB/PqqE/SkfB family radical SAM enzyme